MQNLTTYADKRVKSANFIGPSRGKGTFYMRKWQGATLSVMMAFTLAACSTGGGSTSPTTAGENPEEVVELTSENLQPEEGATLVIWEDKNQSSFIEQRAKKFEEKYGVTVKMEELPPTDQVTKLTTDGPAGLAADVVVFRMIRLVALQRRDLFCPMTYSKRRP